MEGTAGPAVDNNPTVSIATNDDSARLVANVLKSFPDAFAPAAMVELPPVKSLL